MFRIKLFSTRSFPVGLAWPGPETKENDEWPSTPATPVSLRLWRGLDVAFTSLVLSDMPLFVPCTPSLMALLLELLGAEPEPK